MRFRRASLLVVLTIAFVAVAFRFPAPVPHRMVVGRPGTVTILSAGATWPARSVVQLAGSVMVPAGATLTIEPGVVVEAAASTEIVVQRNGRIRAQGTVLEPIVLSCVGTATQGCWDGVTVLGNAPLNHGTPTSPAGGRGGVGGCAESTLDGVPYGGCTASDSSGVLRYVRVQHATHGLRLYGVGSGTRLDHVQVHRSQGHGMEVVGGNARLRYIVLTKNAQYGLAYRGGWVGQAQYVVVQQDPAGYAGGLLAENATGSAGNPDAAPRSAPTLANLTILAPTRALPNASLPAAPAALRFARGAAGTLHNVLLVEPGLGVDVDDGSTCLQVSAGALVLRGVALTSPVALTDPDADPSECAGGGEPALLSGATTLTGPQLRSPLTMVVPDLRPLLASGLATIVGVTPPAAGVLETARYLGAVAPSAGSEDVIPWYSGWTLGEAPAPFTAAGLYPNEPAGLTTISDNEFSSPAPAAVGSTTPMRVGVTGVEWQVYLRDAGAQRLASDPTAPRSPSQVMLLWYPKGLASGYSPAVSMGYTTREYSTWYEAGWFKIGDSTGFAAHGILMKALGFWSVNGSGSDNQFFAALEPTTVGHNGIEKQFRWRFLQQGVAARHVYPNINVDKRIIAGRWHRYEILMGINDIGVANGTLKVWLDGMLQYDYRDWTWRTSSAPRGFYGRKLDPVWGGTGNEAKIRDDFIAFDHIRASGR
jgi:hypothetical protein